MKRLNGMSMSDKVLLAVFEKWPEGEFTSEALVVACWQKYPQVFGLQGFSDQYPDSNVIYRYIMGKDSIVKKQRWLIQAGPKLYRITPAGVSHALKLIAKIGTVPQLQQERLERFQEQLLARVLASPAWKKYISKHVEEITLADACGFWSITPRSSGEQYRSARRDMEEAFNEVKHRLEDLGHTISISGKTALTLPDIELLKALNQTLEERFRNELSIINRRSVRWGQISTGLEGGGISQGTENPKDR